MKKNTTVVTHTEILCYAISHLQGELDRNLAKFDGIPGCEEQHDWLIKQYQPKLDVLKELYRIETGSDY